jgi:hypothetical protein
LFREGDEETILNLRLSLSTSRQSGHETSLPIADQAGESMEFVALHLPWRRTNSAAKR